MNFSVNQILREINFAECMSETAVFATLGAVNFVNLVYFSLQKVQKFIKKSKFRAFKSGKIADFALQYSSKLI